MSVELTDEQKAVVEATPRPGEMFTVVAVAGAGKTTTIIEWARRVSETEPGAGVLYIAFNRDIVDEAQRRCEGIAGMRITTFSAMAHAHCTEQGYDVEFEQDIDESEMLQWATALEGATPWDRTEAITMLRNYAYSRDAAIDADRHCSPRVEQWRRGRIAAGARQMAQAIHMRHCRCPFWAAEKLFSMQAGECDERYIVVDEAQDLNASMLHYVTRQRPRAGVILVGDPYQQIYGFRNTVNAFRCVEATRQFRLTHSHRWGHEVGAAATALLQGRTSKPPTYRICGRSALSGKGSTPIACVPKTIYEQLKCPCCVWTSRAVSVRRCPSEVTVIARSNRGMLAAAAAVAECRHHGTHALLLSDYERFRREVVAAMEQFYRSPLQYFSTDAQVLASIGVRKRRLNKWGKAQLAPAEIFIKKHMMNSRTVWGRIEQVAGRGEVSKQGFVALMRECGLLQGDDEATLSPRPPTRVPEPFVVRVTTTHRCKGMEFDHVLLWNDFRVPPRPCALTDEEVHITYVAATRARKSLVLPNSLRAPMGIDDGKKDAKKNKKKGAPATHAPPSPAAVAAAGNIKDAFRRALANGVHEQPVVGRKSEAAETASKQVRLSKYFSGRT